MIVYVETNFIFELGLGREQREHCRSLPELCEQGKGELRLPAYAIAETRGGLHKREKERLEAGLVLKAQRDDAKRHSAEDVPALESAQQSLRLWTAREAEQLDGLLRRLLYGQVKFVSLDHEGLQIEETLRPVKVLSGYGDLLILACILRDLVRRRNAGDTSPSFFVTSDADFRGAASFFRPYSCDLLTSYSAAVARLKGHSA